ncbi:hypothetical protein H8D64_02865 [PVC group bacterium]|nr:hypothetical protein [PVC group bacterium]
MGGLIGLLSTVILVSTLATLVFAVLAYFASKKLFPSSDVEEEEEPPEITAIREEQLLNFASSAEVGTQSENETKKEDDTKKVNIAKVEPFNIREKPDEVKKTESPSAAPVSFFPPSKDKNKEEDDSSSFRRVKLPEMFGPQALTTESNT